jgi:hypothetical protein
VAGILYPDNIEQVSVKLLMEGGVLRVKKDAPIININFILNIKFY